MEDKITPAEPDPAKLGAKWHRRGCGCPACDLIRKGDIQRTEDYRQGRY